jgi:hypothetical protein
MSLRELGGVSLDLLAEQKPEKLEIYAKVTECKRDTGKRMDALVRGNDWA